MGNFLNAAGVTKLLTLIKNMIGANNGIAPLNSEGKVDSSYLPEQNSQTVTETCYIGQSFQVVEFAEATGPSGYYEIYSPGHQSQGALTTHDGVIYYATNSVGDIEQGEFYLAVSPETTESRYISARSIGVSSNAPLENGLRVIINFTNNYGVPQGVSATMVPNITYNSTSVRILENGSDLALHGGETLNGIYEFIYMNGVFNMVNKCIPLTTSQIETAWSEIFTEE